MSSAKDTAGCHLPGTDMSSTSTITLQYTPILQKKQVFVDRDFPREGLGAFIASERSLPGNHSKRQKY